MQQLLGKPSSCRDLPYHHQHGLVLEPAKRRVPLRVAELSVHPMKKVDVGSDRRSAIRSWPITPASGKREASLATVSGA
jgi:hypothetical protein